MMDYSSPVKEGELYSILCGDLVAVGFDFETGVEAIKDRILKTGKKPKAILPVHLYGMPARIDRCV